MVKKDLETAIQNLQFGQKLRDNPQSKIIINEILARVTPYNENIFINSQDEHKIDFYFFVRPGEQCFCRLVVIGDKIDFYYKDVPQYENFLENSVVRQEARILHQISAEVDSNNNLNVAKSDGTIMNTKDPNTFMRTKSSVISRYDRYGINVESNYIQYKDTTLTNLFIDGYTLSNGVDIPVSKLYVGRTSIDIAKVVLTEENQVTYSGIVPLDTRYGVAQMALPSRGTVVNPFDYGRQIIEPISPSEIEELIAKEKDPKVVEGLKLYINNRDQFMYDSFQDKGYVSQREPSEIRDVTGMSR